MATISATTGISPRPGLGASKSKPMSAIITTGGVLSFVTLVVALHFLRPDLSPQGEPTSAYAVGPYSFLMTAAFFSMSMASFALVVALYQRVSLSARFRIGLALLGTWAVGVAIAMVFPMDPDGAPPTLSGTIHQSTAPLTFLSLTAGMILVSFTFGRDEKWRALYRTALTLSFIMLAAFVAAFLSFATDSGTLGITQRIALATAVTWMLLTAIHVRSLASGPVSA